MILGEENFDLMTINEWMAQSSLTKPRRIHRKRKRGNHLRPQSTAEKNLNSAASNNTNTSSTVLVLYYSSDFLSFFYCNDF